MTKEPLYFIDYQTDFLPLKPMTPEEHAKKIEACNKLTEFARELEAKYKEAENKRIAPTPLTQQVKANLQFFDRHGLEHRLDIPWRRIQEPPQVSKTRNGQYLVIWKFPEGEQLVCYNIEYDEEKQQVTKHGGFNLPSSRVRYLF